MFVNVTSYHSEKTLLLIWIQTKERFLRSKCSVSFHHIFLLSNGSVSGKNGCPQTPLIACVSLGSMSICVCCIWKYRWLLSCDGVPTVWVFSAGNRKLLENNDVADAFNDAKEGVISFKKGFWGGSCTSLEQCTDYIATCGDQGKCRGSTSFVSVV